MLRSCTILLDRRRVSEKCSNGRNSFYKVSLSLVFLLWVLLFLSTMWITHGDGGKDAPLIDSVGIPDPDDGWKDEKAVPFEAPSLLDSASVHVTSDLSPSDDINPSEESEDKENSVKESDINSIVSERMLEDLIYVQDNKNIFKIREGDSEQKEKPVQQQAESQIVLVHVCVTCDKL